MAYSYSVYEASGSTRAFGVPFPYLAQGHVHASVNGVEVGTIEWTSTSTINLPSIPSAGATVRVWRRTPLDDQAVRFAGGVLATRDLNRLALVNLFTAQEALDAAIEAKELAGLTEEAALDAYNSSEHADAVASSVENWATVVGEAYEDTLAARDEAVASVAGAVRYTTQSLSPAEKGQARTNIGAVGSSDLAGVAISGSYGDLTGRPSLAAVATSGNYSDLSGKPALGTAAALDVGTTANKVVQLDGTGKLPAVDGSQLTGINAGVPKDANLGIGSFIMAAVVATTVNAGATVAASSLMPLVWNGTGGAVNTGGSAGLLTGTWRNVSGFNLSSGTGLAGGMFQRVS